MAYCEIVADIQILGLLLDILGAYFLIQSFIIKKFPEMYAAAHGQYDGFSIDLLYSWFIQKREAIAGFILLLTGFLLQALGVFFTISTPIFIIGAVTMLAYVSTKIILGFSTSKEAFRKELQKVEGQLG